VSTRKGALSQVAPQYELASPLISYALPQTWQTCDGGGGEPGQLPEALRRPRWLKLSGT